MKAKINEKILCIPPFISTQWNEVSSIHSEDDTITQKTTLIVSLKEGKVIKIENIEPSLRDLAFAAHLQYLEKNNSNDKNMNVFQTLFGEQAGSGIPIRLDFTTAKGLSEGVEGIESAFQHNPSAQIPLLPPEVLEKVASITRLFTNADPNAFPQPEPHCNCMHCQVAREIHKLSLENTETKEEEIEVSADDLKFRSWDIVQIAEQLFTVTDPTNPKLKFNVFLGSPVGCTCGDNCCEHIRAVLST